MKKTFLLYCLLVFSCSSYGQRIIKATVISIPLLTNSTSAVSCNSFDENFSDLINTIEIDSTNFTSLIELLKTSKFKKLNHIDVRGKLVLTLDNMENKSICFNEFGVFFDGYKYFENKQ